MKNSLQVMCLEAELLREEKNYFSLKVFLSRLGSILLFCKSRRCRNHAASYGLLSE